MNKPENDFFASHESSLLHGITEGSASELLALTQQIPGTIVDQAMNLMGSMVEFKELLMMYSCGLKEVRTKFDVLNTEFNTRYRRNPISSIQSRVKSRTSIMEKMMRKGLPFTMSAIESEINDIAGIRVICSYKDDIYTLADALIKQDDVTLISRKDYIAQPKPNGYRSLHMIVSVPVFFADKRRDMKVEVQIRTIAMDFWASLEHQLKYKQEVPEQGQMVARLKACADAISATDDEMMSIRVQMEAAEDIPTREELLFEQFSRLDEPII